MFMCKYHRIRFTEDKKEIQNCKEADTYKFYMPFKIKPWRMGIIF